jgi:hypothetical protein
MPLTIVGAFFLTHAFTAAAAAAVVTLELGGGTDPLLRPLPSAASPALGAGTGTASAATPTTRWTPAGGQGASADRGSGRTRCALVSPRIHAPLIKPACAHGAGWTRAAGRGVASREAAAYPEGR